MCESLPPSPDCKQHTCHPKRETTILPAPNCRFTSSKAGCWPRENKRGIKASPCSPPHLGEPRTGLKTRIRAPTHRIDGWPTPQNMKGCPCPPHAKPSAPLSRRLRVHPCRIPPGSNSSGSRVAGRTPVDKTCHEGGVPVRDRMVSAAAARKGLSGMPCPDHWEGQYAETLVLAALRRPNPPNPNGRCAERMTSSFCDGSITMQEQ